MLWNLCKKCCKKGGGGEAETLVSSSILQTRLTCSTCFSTEVLKELKDLNFLDANRVLSSQNVSVLFLKQRESQFLDFLRSINHRAERKT